MARAALKRKRPDDFGPTPERLAKAMDGDISIGDDQQGGRIYTIQTSPICRMFRDKRLDGIQFTALSRFHSHWWKIMRVHQIAKVERVRNLQISLALARLVVVVIEWPNVST